MDSRAGYDELCAYAMNRGPAANVLARPEGPDRDAAIDDWCRAVWGAYADDNRAAIAALLRAQGIISG